MKAGYVYPTLAYFNLRFRRFTQIPYFYNINTSNLLNCA